MAPWKDSLFMKFLRLVTDAFDAVRRHPQRRLILIALGLAVVAAVALARFMAGLVDPFAGLKWQTTKTQLGTGQFPLPEPVAPGAERPAREQPPAQAPAPTVSPPRIRFTVQIGAFRDQAHARRLAQRAKRAGFSFTLESGTMSDGKAIFRVRLEPPLDAAQTRQLLAELKRKLPALQPILVPASNERDSGATPQADLDEPTELLDEVRGEPRRGNGR